MKQLFFQLILIIYLLVQKTLQSKLLYQYIHILNILHKKIGEYLVSKEFNTKTFTDSSTWSINRATQCSSSSSYTEFKGVSIMGTLGNNENQSKTFSGLPPHWSASVRFDLILLGSLDKSENDHVRIYFDSATDYDFYDKYSYSDGLSLCYNLVDYGDELVLYYKNITHTASSLNIKIYAKTNEILSYEGFGIRNFFLYVDTCHPSCLSCNGPSSNECLTCPPNATKTGNSCACNSGYIQHTNSCVASCTTGYVKDPNSNNCISDNCVGCSSCNTTKNTCNSCNSGLYLHKGHCVSSCPVTAPLTAGFCQDFDQNLINGQYLINGLMSDSFGESEILGMGLSVYGFKGYKDYMSSDAYVSNCGTNHLLGGSFLAGSGSTISGSWTGLAPHWSVRVGFNFWKIDSWDSEIFYFKLDGATKIQQTYSAASGSPSVCGNSWQDLSYYGTHNQTHTSTSLSIEITTNLSEEVSNESFGCTPNCTSCDASGCLVCQATYLMYYKKCYATCPIGSYQNSPTTCADCNPSCRTCNSPGNICTSCNAPNFLNPGTGLTCLPTCPASYWERTSDRTCQQCHSSCYTCSSPGDQNSCLSCSGSLYLYNNQCISTCPSNTYQNTATNNNKCTLCHTSCKTCDGSSLTNCLSCDLPLYYQTTKACVSGCDSNQYADNSQFKCINCDSTCTTCSVGFAIKCTSCSGSYYLDKTTNKCVTTCPTGTFKDTNHECTPCHTSCYTCNGANSNQCLTCSSPSFYQSSLKTCVSSCDSNQYSVITPSRECQNCNLSCQKCSGPSNSECISCSGSSYLTASQTCSSTCPDGTYQNTSNNQCSPCHGDCKTCSGPNRNQCNSCSLPNYFQSSSSSACVISCNTNQYKDDSIATCSSCHASCASCNGNLSSNCLSCTGTLFLDKSSNSCTSTCPTKQYKNPSNNECTDCHSTCATCNGSSINDCSTCNSPLYFQSSTNSCDTNCLSNQYKSSSPVPQCLPCNSICATCSGSSDSQCLTCSGTDLFLQDPTSVSSSCKQLCPDGKYKNSSNKQCSQCDSTCKTCSDVGRTICLSCSLPQYLHPTTNKCVSQCDSNQFQDNSTATCINCHSSCAKCSASNDSSCLSCSAGSFLQSNKCVSSCINGYYGSTILNTCEKCNTSCDTCSGPTQKECQSCTGTKFKHENECTETCPIGFYKNITNNTCSKCHDSCQSCSGGSSNQCQTCSNSLFLFQNQCISTCPNGLYKSAKTNSCESCSTKCQQCSGPSDNECLTCNQGTLLQEQSCLKQCSEGYYENKNIQQCSKCDLSCLTCTGPSINQCETCSDKLIKYNNKCISECPKKTYEDKKITKQCMDCDSSCASNCTGPNKEDCQAIQPQNQIIILILGFKTICWIFSVIIGILRDKKNLENEKNKVLPSKLELSKIQDDSPIRRRRRQLEFNNIETSAHESPIPMTMTKQSTFSSPEKKPMTQQIDGNSKINSSYFPSTFQDLNNEYNMTFQNQEGESPKSKRRSRRTEFVLRSRGNKHLFGQIQSTSNSPSLQNTNRGSSSQVFDKLFTSTPTLNPSHNSSIFSNEKKDKLWANQKLKFSILGNEWVSLFGFYDSQINRINRSTIIYLKYQMFFFICNQFSLVILISQFFCNIKSPLYYVTACLTSGVAMKFIIGNLVFLMTKFSRYGNYISLIIFLSGIFCDLYFWFVPTLMTLKYIQDLKWSIMYAITFSIDFLVLQQIFGLISYLCTVKYINQDQKDTSINKYFKNNYLLNKLKN